MQDVACCIVPFQAYLQDDGDLIQALERIQCFRLSSMFLVMSPQLQFSHVVCLREIWPSPEKCELEHGTENLCEINYEKHQPGKSFGTHQDFLTERCYF